ncbi:RAB6A-GEF complex partner protein 2, partial [Eudyptes schlegeli]
MIEVLAKLGRGPVFLAGEVLECVITFTNPLSASSTSASSEMLAWASAQIHCQFHASENRVALPPSDGSKHDVQAENETVFVPNRGERGQCILSTPPKILFCDLRLDPGESKSCESCLFFPGSESSPLGSPALQAGFADLSAASGRPCCSRKARCFGGSVSAKELLHRPESVLHRMRAVYRSVSLSPAPGPCPLPQVRCAAARHRTFEIRAPVLSTFGKGRPWGFAPGLREIVRASTLLIALQFSVSLQTEESIQEEFQRRRGQPVSFSTHARHQEACLHTAQSSFSLPIPLSSTPGFTTNIVSLKWRLHFEFVTSGESAGTCLVRGSQSEAVTWTGVEQIEVDTFSWDLPIKVLPTNPILASYVSQFSSTNSITI